MTHDLLEAAMALPPQERAELAERLWASLPNEIAGTTFAEDLAREVRSRRERHLQAGLPLHSWIEVRGELDEIIRQLAHDDVAVLMISDEIPEVLYHSHRVLVMREGRLTTDVAAAATSEDALRQAVNV